MPPSKAPRLLFSKALMVPFSEEKELICLPHAGTGDSACTAYSEEA